MDALAGLAPTAESYARLPLPDAFTWDDCAAAIDPGEWYLVAFRSIIRPGADVQRLMAYDDWAHAEASEAPGFVHYFKGPLAADGSCLSFCLWTSRAEARAASGRSAHRDAVALVSETYAEYTLEFVRLSKASADARLEFAPHDAAAQPVPSPTLSPAPLGFSSASA